MRHVLAILNRWWQHGGSYVATFATLAAALIGAVTHDHALTVTSYVLIMVVLAVNLSYGVPLVRMLLKRRAVKRARRARTGGAR